MKIVREMFNRTEDQWEFLTDDGHILVEEGHDGFQSWTLYRLTDTSVLDENWKGQEVWQRDFVNKAPDEVVAVYEREQKNQYSCELFADLGADTKRELDLAYHHIEAGDLTGALQHLAQFAAWAIQEYADVDEAHKLLDQFGPWLANGHLHLTAKDGMWQLDQTLNEIAYGHVCSTCLRPGHMCTCTIPF
jgi:hypothetical protein